jgi:hypothetical protein
VVVDDVEQHGEAGPVRGVDELLEAERAAVGGLRGGQVDAVVAPAVAAGELADRHQLDGGDPQLPQLAQVRDDRLEGAFGGERADVQLVEDEVVDGGRHPLPVRPLEGAGIDHAGRPPQPFRLPAARGIGQRLAVEHERVIGAGGSLHDRLVDAVAGVLHGVLAPVHPQLHVVRLGSPDAELHAAVRQRMGAEAALERQRIGMQASSGLQGRATACRAAAAAARPRTAGSSIRAGRPRSRRGCRRPTRRRTRSRC